MAAPLVSVYCTDSMWIYSVVHHLPWGMQQAPLRDKSYQWMLFFPKLNLFWIYTHFLWVVRSHQFIIPVVVIVETIWKHLNAWSSSRVMKLRLEIYYSLKSKFSRFSVLVQCRNAKSGYSLYVFHVFAFWSQSRLYLGKGWFNYPLFPCTLPPLKYGRLWYLSKWSVHLITHVNQRKLLAGYYISHNNFFILLGTPRSWFQFQILFVQWFVLFTKLANHILRICWMWVKEKRWP